MFLSLSLRVDIKTSLRVDRAVLQHDVKKETAGSEKTGLRLVFEHNKGDITGSINHNTVTGENNCRKFALSCSFIGIRRHS